MKELQNKIMAYKQQILLRYQQDIHNDSTQKFDQELYNTMQEKFCNLEYYVQQLKYEINLKTSFVVRLSKLEQMFLTVKTGVQFLMDDLVRLPKLRKARSLKKLSEVKKIEELMKTSLVLQKTKKQILSIEKNVANKKRLKNYPKEDKNLVSHLNGKFWIPPISKSRKIQKSRKKLR